VRVDDAEAPLARIAREVGAEVGLVHKAAVIPRRESQLMADIREVMRAGVTAPGDVARGQALLHFAGAVRSRGLSHALVGGIAGAAEIAARVGVEVVDPVAGFEAPFAGPEVLWRAFPELGRIRPLLEIAAGHDVAAELRGWHETLVGGDYNLRRRTTLAGFCQDMREVVETERWRDLEVRPAACGGSGVFATRRIPAGQVVLSYWYTGPFVGYADQLHPDHEWLTIQFAEDRYVLCDIAEPHRYVNHACEPSCFVRNGLELHAARDLEPGDEITFDYSTTMGPAETWTHACLCSSPGCRGRIGNFVELTPAEQKRYLDADAVGAHARR
jgi:SET domain-containing protein